MCEGHNNLTERYLPFPQYIMTSVRFVVESCLLPLFICCFFNLHFFLKLSSGYIFVVGWVFFLLEKFFFVLILIWQSPFQFLHVPLTFYKIIESIWRRIRIYNEIVHQYLNFFFFTYVSFNRLSTLLNHNPFYLFELEKKNPLITLRTSLNTKLYLQEKYM